MYIDRLVATNFRNFSHLSVNLHSHLNVFIGHNGSGKSSIVEALHLLGFGRSFRSNKLTSCIKHGEAQFSVYVESVKYPSSVESKIKVGIGKSKLGEIQSQIDGDHRHRLNDLVKLFPVQLFTPQSTDLILGSPKDRRRFLDWGVFHVEHRFEMINRNFKIALRNRNALLKMHNVSHTELAIWDDKFAEFGSSIDNYRQQYLQSFKPIFKDIQGKFLKGFTVEIEYNKGWKGSDSLLDALAAKLNYDAVVKLTTVGPHKADLKFKVDGKDAAEVLSRGQLRMLVAALLLAQTATFNKKKNEQTIFLLDDIGAELDEEKRALFLEELHKTNSQIVVTSIDEQQLAFTKKYENKKMFHVEHGSVREE
jgi:DNA replication and repair protein RecF